jgi:hypothetical protein
MRSEAGRTAPLRLHAHAARYFVGGGGRQQREDLQHQLRTAAEGGPGISTCQAGGRGMWAGQREHQIWMG